MKKLKYIALSVLAFGLISCENDTLDDLRNRVNPDVEALPDLSVGDLDLSNYVSVGASFTAGVVDGGLFIASQDLSFPNTLAKQFASGGGGEFSQPLMSDNTGGILVNGNVVGGYRLVFDGEGPVPLNLFLTAIGAPVPPITTDAINNIGSDYNNFGIPGAKSFHMVTPGYGAFNPFYGRIASSAGATVLGDALAQNPTFFTLSEMGGNDILQYATAGGSGADQTGNTNPLTYGPNDITDPMVLEGAIGQMVSALTTNGAKGILTNVPFITDLPHFTTITWDFLDPNDEDVGPALVPQIPLLNAQLYGPLDGIFTAFGEPDRINLLSDTEPNPLLIQDEDAIDRSAEITGALTPVLGAQTAALFGSIFGKARQTTEADLVVLGAAGILASEQPGIPAPVNVNGISFPLADQWVLIPSEQTALLNATIAYNNSIENIANSNADVALVDLNAILTEASTTGIEFDEYVLTTELVVGGLVSLDGIHLTPRGYALMANKFLEALDENFGSNFKASGNMAKAGEYPTNFSPLLQ